MSVCLDGDYNYYLKEKLFSAHFKRVHRQLTFWSQMETQGLWKKWWHGSSVAMSSLMYSLQQMGQHCS